MGVASVYGCKEVRTYIDFLILLLPTPLVPVHFCSIIPTFVHFVRSFSFFFLLYLCNFQIIRYCRSFG